MKLPGYVVGIEDIIEEDSMENAVPVAYYDLMGHEVKNPGNGIYIVRLSNGKAVKRVIR